VRTSKRALLASKPVEILEASPMAEDPVPLFDESGSELLKSLFSAARDEQPSAQAVQRTLAVIGVGSAVLGTASTASAAGAAVGNAAGAPSVIGAASLGSAKGVASATLLVVVKWLGAGAVAGLVATSAIYAVSEPVLPAPVVTHPAVAAVAPTDTAKVPLTAPFSAATEPEVHAEPEVKAEPEPASARAGVSAATLPSTAPPAPQPLSVAAEVDPAAPLAAELALLDSARQALAAGNAARALRSLNDYDVRFVHPNLAPEALYLRLEALTLQGDKAGTEATARRLLRAYPAGPHAARARSVLGITP
jgi:hypothetical protein